MKEQINNWLRFENFAAGIQLLAKNGVRMDLVDKYKSLSNGTPAQRSELLAAMRQLLAQKDETPTLVHNIAAAPKPMPQRDAIYTKQNSKCVELLRTRSSTHTLLKAATTNEERYELAAKIKQLTKKIDEAYDTLRYVEETGKMPFNKTDEAQLISKGIVMMKSLQSLKAQLSQARKANDKAKEADLMAQIEELSKNIAEYDK